MIGLEDRQTLVRHIDEAHAAGARLRPACEVAGMTLRTLQRWKAQEGLRQGDRRPLAKRAQPAHALSDEERARIQALANEPRFADQPPARIVPTLADEGVYLASESSFQRVLRAHGQTGHRGRSRAPQRTAAPTTHVASAPGQVWCWDMTYLPTHVKGQWFYLYLIMDLYSRKIVGWEIHATDEAEHAVSLLKRTALAEGLHALPEKPVLHGDNGSTLKATTVLAMLHWLGIKPSYSRPRVSDDNAFVESLFKTAKYRPNSRRAASPAWTKPASGDSTSCTGTTSSTATAACATSPPPNGMPGKTMRSWRHGTRPIFKPANVTRRAGPGRHGTGHRSGPSRSTRNGTASFGTLPKLK